MAVVITSGSGGVEIHTVFNCYFGGWMRIVSDARPKGEKFHQQCQGKNAHTGLPGRVGQPSGLNY